MRIKDMEGIGMLKKGENLKKNLILLIFAILSIGIALNSAEACGECGGCNEDEPCGFSCDSNESCQDICIKKPGISEVESFPEVPEGNGATLKQIRWWNLEKALRNGYRYPVANQKEQDATHVICESCPSLRSPELEPVITVPFKNRMCEAPVSSFQRKLIAKIFFHSGEIDPLEEQKDILLKAFQVVEGYPIRNISVTGHACEYSENLLNSQLSIERARSISNLLWSEGFRVDRFSGNGSNFPLTGKVEDVELNRRVEVYADISDFNCIGEDDGK